MGKEQQLSQEIFQAVMAFAREKHTEMIDKAYEFFWDDLKPDEFLGGQAYAIGFHNFEDWFVFDHVPAGAGESIIDLYLKAHPDLPAEQVSMIAMMKDSVLSVYEVRSVAKDKRVLLKDLLRGDETELRDKALTRGLSKGELFGARLLVLDGRTTMSGSVYPFPADQKKRVLAYLNGEFSKFTRNVDAQGTMNQFLKRHGDLVNLTWIDLILNPQQQEEKSRH